MTETITTDDESYVIYLLEGWADDVDSVPTEDADGNAVEYTTILVSGSDGLIKIDGLNYGTYTVTETKAPDGFNLLDYTIAVTIDENGNVSMLASNAREGAEATQLTDKTVNIQNNTGDILPGIGGIGTTIFYVLGGNIVVGAVVVLVTRKRIGSAD